MTFRKIDFGDMYFVASATYWGSMGAERWAVTSYLFRFDQRATRRFGTKNHDVLTASKNLWVLNSVTGVEGQISPVRLITSSARYRALRYRVLNGSG